MSAGNVMKAFFQSCIMQKFSINGPELILNPTTVATFTTKL